MLVLPAFAGIDENRLKNIDFMTLMMFISSTNSDRLTLIADILSKKSKNQKIKKSKNHGGTHFVHD